MKLFGRFSALSIIGALFLYTSCDEYKTIDYSKYQAEEIEILNKYLTDKVKYGGENGVEMSRLDSLTKAAIDTVDNYHSHGGIIYFTKEVGVGEPVVAGDIVGYRYKTYAILLDTVGVANRYYAGSNYNDLEPAFGKAGSVSSSSGFYSGINDAILKMNKFGKSTVIVPSTVGNSSYVTYIYDLEVVYIQK
jgi:hypothetical protein